MVYEQATPTEANPFGAFFACHERHGISSPDPDRAVGWFDAPRLFRLQIWESGKDVEAVARLVVKLAASHSGVVAAAHHHRHWPVDTPPSSRFTHMAFLAFPPSAGGSLREKLQDTLWSWVYRTHLDVLWGEDLAVRANRAQLVDAVAEADCAKLRYVMSPPAFRPLDREVSSCDSVESLFQLAFGILDSHRSEQNRYIRTDLSGVASLLAAAGSRNDDRRAFLAANILSSEMDLNSMWSALYDVQLGRL